MSCLCRFEFEKAHPNHVFQGSCIHEERDALRARVAELEGIVSAHQQHQANTDARCESFELQRDAWRACAVQLAAVMETENLCGRARAMALAEFELIKEGK